MEDTKIIDLYFERSESAIKETANKYGAYLNRVVFNILRCREDTEEIVNDTYVNAWNSIPPAKPRVLKHYLSRIARNLSFSRLDYITAEKRNPGIIEQLSELDECIPDRCSVEKEWEAAQLGAVLNRFLASLSREDCAIFLSRYYYSMSIREIAERNSMKERRVKYTLACLRSQLKEHLEREDITK